MSIRADGLVLLLVGALLAGCVQTARPPGAAPVVERGRAEKSRDDDLGATVTKRVRALDPAAFRAVSAKAVGGRVLLTGVVVKPEQRRRAERTAATVDGATEVRNEIQLAEDRAFDQFTPDTARETALLERLAADPAIGSRNLDLRLVNNVAYVVGTARDAGEIERIRANLTEAPGVKWVVAAVTAP